jgi:hypothetical protein
LSSASKVPDGTSFSSETATPVSLKMNEDIDEGHHRVVALAPASKMWNSTPASDAMNCRGVSTGPGTELPHAGLGHPGLQRRRGPNPVTAHTILRVIVGKCW